jgi:hypothetical protein
VSSSPEFRPRFADLPEAIREYPLRGLRAAHRHPSAPGRRGISDRNARKGVKTSEHGVDAWSVRLGKGTRVDTRNAIGLITAVALATGLFTSIQMASAKRPRDDRVMERLARRLDRSAADGGELSTGPAPTTTLTTTTTAPPRATTTTSLPTTGGATAVRMVPSSIVSDCSRPVDGELNAWLRSVPDGSTILFGAGRCYGQDGTLFVTDRSNLTIDGNGSTFKTLTVGTPGRDSWRIEAGRNIILKNMIIRGANPAAGLTDTAYQGAYEWQHAFAFNGTQTGLLDNVQAYDMYGDFVEAQFDLRSYWLEAFPARNITVRNAHFERNGRQGFGLTWVEGFRLENSYVGEVNMAVIDLEPDDPKETITDIVITGNTFGRRRFSLVSSAGAGFGDNVGRITFTNNREIGPLYSCRPPIFLEPTPGRVVNDVTIADNQFLAYGDTIDLTRVTNATIARNQSQFTNGQCGRSSGVRLTDSHTINITDNTFTGSSATVTADSSSTEVTVANNVS